MPYIRPVALSPGKVGISATFKQHLGRTPPSIEAGIDYYMPMRTPVGACEGGIVVFRGPSGPVAGLRIQVRCDDGNYFSDIHGAAFITNGATNVGDRVKRGQTILLSGMAGSGPHLHHTFWRGIDRPAGYVGRPIPGDKRWPTYDFEKFLTEQSAPAGGGGVPFDPTTGKKLPMHCKLWLYTPTNDLIIVDHLNMTWRSLGHVTPHAERDRFAADATQIQAIGEPAWTTHFKGFRPLAVPDPA